ncbi:MAG TPA: DnaJ C-terminal domain-containing protein [Burkholderiaceae bacterium]|nr:DnaJ C-terminal domain-containing protein [Burkholderiaceae bacterium]
MKYKDYYQILGVERTATTNEIKQAYRKLAHKYHPDISKDPAGEQKFKEIAEAYATLKDTEKRQEYDSLGQRAPGENFTPPPDWQQHFGAGPSAFDDVDLADIFASFSRQQGGRGRRDNMPIPGQDYELQAVVTLEQIFNGDTIDIQATLPEYDQHGLRHHVSRTFRVTIPKGAAEGQRLRLSGKGGPGRNGGKNGDLYVALSIKPHPLYQVSGRDLYIDLPLAPWEAVLGAAVQLPTLGGTVELNIKPGTVTGQRLRLARRGLPSADGGAGDLYAVVTIDVGKTVKPRERELYEQLAAASDFNPRKRFTQGATR